MSEINYFKILYYIRWCRLVVCEKYKLMDDMVVDDTNKIVYQENYIK
jgi:hypothetical protein